MWANRVTSPPNEDIVTTSSKQEDADSKTRIKPKKSQILPASLAETGFESLSSSKFHLISRKHRNPNKDKGYWPEQLAALHVIYKRINAVWRDIASIRGKYRKLWNLGQKIGDLTMQSIFLHQLLQDGSSTLLVMGYAVFLCTNTWSVAAGIMVGNQSALNEILVDSLFDMIAAVLYPILVLFYSANRFDFDRELFSINVLPPGSFECNARLFADPAERALFITS